MNVLKYDSLRVETQCGFVHKYITLLIEGTRNTSDVQREAHDLSVQMIEYCKTFRFTWKLSKFRGYIASEG